MGIRSATISLLLLCCMHVSAQQHRLFSAEMRNAAPRLQVVMNFFERYFQEMMAQDKATVQTRMADDKVYFREGSPQHLYQVTEGMPCSISLVDRHYEICWTKDSAPFVTVVFPAQYDLILGMPQNEIQQRLQQEIRQASPRTEAPEPPYITEKLANDILMSKTEILELESLSDATYYDGVYEQPVPIFDGTYQEYSAANLFHGLIADAAYRMDVEQSVYGLSTINYSIPLSQWLDYCAEQGLKVFFAIEEERENGLLAMVIAHHNELCYNHLLSVLIPNGFVDHPDAVLKVRLTPYIPMHNVKDLYQIQTITPKKKVWQ